MVSAMKLCREAWVASYQRRCDCLGSCEHNDQYQNLTGRDGVFVMYQRSDVQEKQMMCGAKSPAHLLSTSHFDHVKVSLSDEGLQDGRTRANEEFQCYT